MNSLIRVLLGLLFSDLEAWVGGIAKGNCRRQTNRTHGRSNTRHNGPIVLMSGLFNGTTT